MGGSSTNPSAPATSATPTPAASGPQGYTAQQIQNLYTDSLKTYDVPRALKGVSPSGPGGTYTLAQLQGLNPDWMSQRSRADWNSALSGLGSIGGSGGGGGATPPLDPHNPPPGFLTTPWQGLAQNDPSFSAMARNAGYGDTITPMPTMNPQGWNPNGQAMQSPTLVTGGNPNQGQSIPWQSLASMLGK